MDWNLFWTAGGTIAAFTGILYLMFRNLKIDLNEKFDKIDKKIENINSELKEIRKDISGLSDRLSRLEVRVEERTLKVVHVQRQVQGLDPAKEN